ncbi:hypothetical protein ACQ86E_24430 [Bradyrhizobium betae]|uniref:hypothetical protein n=1 Tax=Bradyrhizobium betae TaxID=244734 RepID=UPI003D67C16F
MAALAKPQHFDHRFECNQGDGSTPRETNADCVVTGKALIKRGASGFLCPATIIDVPAVARDCGFRGCRRSALLPPARKTPDVAPGVMLLTHSLS